MAENEQQKAGEVTHFFAGPSAAVLKLSGSLKVGDTIHIVGFTTDLVEKLTSMQIDHNSVQTAGPGDDVAILVKDRVREGDEVFLVPEGFVSPPKPAPGSVSVPAAFPVAVKPVPSSKLVAKPAAKKATKPKAKAKPKKKDTSKAKAKAKKAKTKKTKAKAKPKAKAKKSKKKR